MARLLLLLLLGLLGWLLVKKLSSFLTGDKAPGARPPPAPVAEPMVPCRHCGVNLPLSEARAVEGGHECADRNQCGHRT